MGLCTGAAAAAEETSENAAAVAASSASPPAMFIPELGALAYGAGAELAVERLGGDRTQALLRAHAHPITALAHHPSTRRIASASASADAPRETASVFLWDARTGSEDEGVAATISAGGGVVSLAFSPKGDKILSVGADPAGAVAVWDAVTGASLGRASAAAPAAGGAWCRGEAPEFVVFGAEGAALFRVLDQTPRRGENGENREEDDDVGDDVGDGDGDGDDAGDDDSDAGSTAAPKSNGLASAKFSFSTLVARRRRRRRWRRDSRVHGGVRLLRRRSVFGRRARSSLARVVSRSATRARRYAVGRRDGPVAAIRFRIRSRRIRFRIRSRRIRFRRRPRFVFASPRSPPAKPPRRWRPRLRIASSWVPRAARAFGRRPAGLVGRRSGARTRRRGGSPRVSRRTKAKTRATPSVVRRVRVRQSPPIPRRLEASAS